MERVIVTNPFIGLLYMQVCAAKDVTDEEVLDACNLLNPSGTSLGWCEVKRDGEGGPVQCADYDDRIHLLVSC
jgi:hypothetical protein